MDEMLCLAIRKQRDQLAEKAEECELYARSELGSYSQRLRERHAELARRLRLAAECFNPPPEEESVAPAEPAGPWAAEVERCRADIEDKALENLALRVDRLESHCRFLESWVVRVELSVPIGLRVHIQRLEGGFAALERQLADLKGGSRG